MISNKHLICLVLFKYCLTQILTAQPKTLVIDSLSDRFTKTVIAGPQYNRSKMHQWLWGKHYREEWATPVKIKAINLDTMYGGLKPILRGGGRQTKTLRLENPNGKQYVLRSVDKTFGRALPPIFNGTFVEKLINDQVSIAHPYAAITIPPMINAAGVYHTTPEIVYVPKQNALDSFNHDFGEMLFVLEERPDDDQSDASNFGYAENVIGTKKLIEKLLAKNNRIIDQAAFVKARLFDMFIGDWSRHEDQWRWTEFKDEKPTVYIPVPRDRDQAYTKFDGILLSAILSAANLDHLQSFGYKIKDVNRYNFPARHLDRLAANALPLSEWQNIAKELQEKLTDSVIEAGVRKLPAEVFHISGPEIIAKLKSRRAYLYEYAHDYYHLLAREVNVVGSKESETFIITNAEDNKIKVAVHDVDKNGALKEPFYERVFTPSETKEIRLYGLGGNDAYHIDQNLNSNIRIRIIGGPDRDSFSIAAQSNRIRIYDNRENTFSNTAGAKLRLSNDASIHRYDYDDFELGTRGTIKKISYNREDRLYVGVGYKIRTQKWRRAPFAHDHRFIFSYSPIQRGIRLLYEGVVNQAVGNWNLSLLAEYDAIRWTNYFGVGNETVLLTDNRDFYRLRSSDIYTGIGLNRRFGNHFITTNLLYQSIKLINDPERFYAKDFANHDVKTYDSRHYIGPELRYQLQSVDNIILPRKGIEAEAGISYTHNLKQEDRSFTRYDGVVQFYIPLLKPFTLAVKAGGATLTGEPDFFQLNRLGGAFTLRGHIRDRFYGRTMAYNNNELQWIFNVRSRLFNGQASILGLYDIGRVWMPGEESDTWHKAFGGGFTIAPFNKMAFTVTYSISKENRLAHFRIRRAL